MFEEELPAIFSFAVIVVVFLATFWQDLRRSRHHPLRPERRSSQSADAHSPLEKRSQEKTTVDN